MLENDEGKIKVIQAVAGLRVSYVLTDHLKILGFGTSISFAVQKAAFNYQLDLIRVYILLFSKHLIAKVWFKSNCFRDGLASFRY